MRTAKLSSRAVRLRNVRPAGYWDQADEFSDEYMDAEDEQNAAAMDQLRELLSEGLCALQAETYGLTKLVSPAIEDPGKLRITTLMDGNPLGHQEPVTLSEIVIELWGCFKRGATCRALFAEV